MDQAGDRTGRAKYLDWCSARLAERFLDLSPEEIYELAQPGRELAAETMQRGRDRLALPQPTEAGYRALVQRVTDSLLERMPLPTYEQWAAAYAETPERFDAELLGLWKEVAAEGEGEGEGEEEAGEASSPSGGPA